MYIPFWAKMSHRIFIFYCDKSRKNGIYTYWALTICICPFRPKCRATNYKKTAYTYIELVPLYVYPLFSKSVTPHVTDSEKTGYTCSKNIAYLYIPIFSENCHTFFVTNFKNNRDI